MKKSILFAVLSTAAAVSGLLAQGAALPPRLPLPKARSQNRRLNSRTPEPLRAQGNPDATIKAADELLVKFADTSSRKPPSPWKLPPTRRRRTTPRPS